MTTSASGTLRSADLKSDLVKFVRSQVNRLQQRYLADHSDAVAALAKLRRAVGKPAGSALDVYEYTFSEKLVRGWNRDEPSNAETAAHVAITLYAVHQQSRSEGMHVEGRRLGAALGQLARLSAPEAGGDQLNAGVVRRFTAMGTAESFAELCHHLRGLVQLLRTQSIPLDYGLLARDLWLWQFPKHTSKVQFSWGRDFYLKDKKAQAPSLASTEETDR